MFEGKEWLMRLSAVPGGSGDESRVAAALMEAAGPYVDEMTLDAIGNAILTRRGSGSRRPRVMLAAHMDEISLLVRAIEPRGFLRVSQAGGFDPRALLGQEVLVHGRETLRGIIGSKPPHLSSAEDRKKSIPLDDLFIDIGMPEEQVRKLVAVGDRITIDKPVMALLEERLAGKAMDDRASLTAMLICLDELTRLRAKADVFAVGTVQEEIGCKGAQTAAFGLMPDLAVAIDVCHGETPGISDDRVQKIGGGPVITFGPFIHPQLFARLRDIAKDNRMDVQIEVAPGHTSTDADPIGTLQAGIPTALISIPLRYMHTAVETLDYADVRNAGILLAQFIASLDAEFVEGLSCF
ncbi:MAG: M20/M25/M40 family metallo-hydrolase [Firmicutes bacterium]|nr:M20/M25/M40 family metallo-hydrolase [Bacillota bacterium]